jgi:sugar-specific transcriptional regulator TrmB
LQSSSVYHIIDILKNKGLISLTIKNNIKYYNSVESKELLDHIDEKIKSLETIKYNFSNLKRNLEKKDSQVKVYEGYWGFLSAYKEAINLIGTGEEIFTFVLSKYTGEIERIETVKEILRRTRKEKKIKLNVIIRESDKDTIGKDHEKAYKTEVRYINNSLIYPTMIHIIGDCVLMGIIDEPKGILIKNDKTAQTYKNIFMNLWRSASK